MPHRLQKLVRDAAEACRELRVFTDGKCYQDVVDDRGLQLIIERLFEVLGEALYRIRIWMRMPLISLPMVIASSAHGIC